MKKTLEWTHPALHLVQKALVAAVAIIAAVGLFALPVTAFAADNTLSLPEPDHLKTATPNGDGTYKITLSVTGKSDSSSSKTSANVIVVLDTSGSMNEIVDQSAVVAERDGNGMYGRRNGQYIRLYYTEDGDVVYQASNGRYYYYNGYRYNVTAGTRIAVAKQALSNLADQLISSSDSTVKIALETFSGYGNDVSDYYGAGKADAFKSLVNSKTADGGTNWVDALKKANTKAQEDSSTPTYIVFLSDGKPTYGVYSDGTRSGDGTETQSSSDLAQFVTDAVNTANDRPDNVYGFYAVYTGADAATSMNNFASRANASNNGAAINGSDSAALNAALNSIVTTIQSSISYTNVKITDSNSDAVQYVLPTGATEPTFTYTKGGQIWADAPTAHVVNGKVEWNLEDRTLEQNVTYSVSFNVELKQSAYDDAAPADGKTAVKNVDTNSAAQLAYSTVITKDGVPGTPTAQSPVDIPSPNVDVPTSKLEITKTWAGDGNKPSSLELKIKQDGKDYKTVTMTSADADSDRTWKKFVDVATGPDGHSYTIEEVEPANWAETTRPSDVNFKSLKEEIKPVDITNTYKTGKLTLTKNLKGNAANVSDWFVFTLTCKDLAGKTYGDITFDTDGKATVRLQNGDSETIEGLPAGETIAIEEATSNKNQAQTTTTTTVKVDGDTRVNEKTQTSVDAPIEYGKTTAVTYTNKTEIAPDTGLDISTTSQGVLLGVAAAGAATLAAAAIRKNHGERKER